MSIAISFTDFWDGQTLIITSTNYFKEIFGHVESFSEAEADICFVTIFGPNILKYYLSTPISRSFSLVRMLDLTYILALILFLLILHSMVVRTSVFHYG